MKKHPLKDLVNIDIVSDILLELTDTNEFICSTFATEVAEINEIVYCEIEMSSPCSNLTYNDDFNYTPAKVVHNRYELVKLKTSLSIVTKKEYDLSQLLPFKRYQITESKNGLEKSKECLLYLLKESYEFNDVILRLKDYLKDDWINDEAVKRNDCRLELIINFYSYDTKLLNKY